MVYANTAPGGFNGFYKMTSEEVTEIYEKFFCGYFGCSSEEEAEKSCPDIRWLHPLAWFRCCTSMLKGDRWPAEKRELAQASYLCACPSRKIERSRSHRRPSEGRCIAGEPELPV